MAKVLLRPTADVGASMNERTDILNLKVEVTQDHIARSEDENCWRCAVTFAVYDAMAKADLHGVDELYRSFDPECPYSVSCYTDHIALWVEDGARDLILAIARYPTGSVPLHPKTPMTFDAQFVLADDAMLDNWSAQ